MYGFIHFIRTYFLIRLALLLLLLFFIVHLNVFENFDGFDIGIYQLSIWLCQIRMQNGKRNAKMNTSVSLETYIARVRSNVRLRICTSFPFFCCRFSFVIFYIHSNLFFKCSISFWYFKWNYICIRCVVLFRHSRKAAYLSFYSIVHIFVGVYCKSMCKSQRVCLFDYTNFQKSNICPHVWDIVKCITKYLIFE